MLVSVYLMFHSILTNEQTRGDSGDMRRNLQRSQSQDLYVSQSVDGTYG